MTRTLTVLSLDDGQNRSEDVAAGRTILPRTRYDKLVANLLSAVAFATAVAFRL